MFAKSDHFRINRSPKVNILSSCGFHEKQKLTAVKYQCFAYKAESGKVALGMYVSAMLLTS